MFTPSKIAIGLFAFLAAGIALGRGLQEGETPRLNRLKKTLGRTCGLMTFFITDIAMPLVTGLLYLSKGVAETGMLAIVP